jgi:SAM-dependent methyltransferase
VSDYLANTRRSYDVAAHDYATWIAGELATKPFDRAVLTTFAELVRGPVADVGCGTGRIAAFLHDLGVDVFGVDLSPRMLAVARGTHPDLRFTEGSMTALEIGDSLGGIVAWYSTIHIPDADLPTVFAGFHRVLAPGGYLQLAFQVGDEVEHRTRAGSHEVALDLHHRQPAEVAKLLDAAGLPVKATLQRVPDEQGAYAEDTPQAYVLAQKPGQPR